MPKTRQQKEEAIQHLVSGIAGSKGAVFANFHGLKVSESDELRGKCREQGIGFTATKKTLLTRALKDAGFNVDAKTFEGGIAAVLAPADEVAPAKLVAEFAKSHEVVTIFGGILEGKFIDAAKVSALAKLPSKEQLYAKIVGTINAPVSGFVNVLAGNLRGLATVLNNIKDAKV